MCKLTCLSDLNTESQLLKKCIVYGLQVKTILLPFYWKSPCPINILFHDLRINYNKRALLLGPLTYPTKPTEGCHSYHINAFRFPK